MMDFAALRDLTVDELVDWIIARDAEWAAANDPDRPPLEPEAVRPVAAQVYRTLHPDD